MDEELENIINEMIANNESEDFIVSVIEKYNDKKSKNVEELETSVEEIAPVSTEVEEIDTDPVLENGSLELKNKTNFVPDPRGDEYYSSLPDHFQEKQDYIEWKNSGKDKILEEDTFEKRLEKIFPLEKTLYKNEDKNFKHVSSNPKLYNIIEEAEQRNQLEVNGILTPAFELEKYYPGRFKIKQQVTDELETIYYDTENNNKEVNPEEFLSPIRDLIIEKEAASLKNRLKGNANFLVDFEMNKLEKSTAFEDENFNNLSNYYKTGNLTSDAEEGIKRLKKTFDKGVYSSSQKELYEEYKSTGDIEPENFLRTKANTGNKAYDEDGNLIGVSVKEVSKPVDKSKFKLTDSEAELVDIKTEKYQSEAPTVDFLLNKRNNIYFELLAVDKKISQNKDIVKEAAGFFNVQGDNIEQASKASADFLGENLSKIRVDHPLAAQHNDRLIELIAINRAIKLNSNLMTISDNQGSLGRYISTLQESMTGGSTNFGTNLSGQLGSPSQAAEAYKNILEDAGLEIDESILQEGINQTSIGETSIDVLANITPLLVSIAATKQMTVKAGGKTYGVKPTLDKLDLITKNFTKNKGTAAKKAYNLINGITKEVITIGSANEFNYTVFNQEKMPLSDAVVFGAGNSVVAGMSKYIATKYIPYFSEFARTRMGVVLNAAGQKLAGGASATAIGKANEAVNLAANYYLGDGNKQTFDEGMKHLTSLNALCGDLIAFTALGIRGEAVTDVKNRLLAIDNRSTATIEASKLLNVKEFSSTKKISEALDKKIKELGVDKMNLAQMNSPEVKSKVNKLKLAAEKLNTQNNIVEAQKEIAKSTNNIKTTEAKLDIISKKIATEQKLTPKEVIELGKFSNTHVENGKNGYNFRTPVEALTVVMAEKIGIKKGSQEFNDFQEYLAKKSALSSISDQQFRGESKQTKKAKEQYIGKFLDMEAISTEDNRLKSIIKANPELEPLYRQQIKENKQKLDEASLESSELIKKTRASEKNEYQSDVDFVQKVAKDLGIGFKELKASEYIEKANEFGYSNTSEGVYLTKDNTILINKDAALKNGAVSVASHELAHALARRSFKNNKGIFTTEGIKAIDDFKNNILSNEQRTKVENRIKEKYNPESKDFKEKQYEEYLNVFLDGVKRGEFKLNEGSSQIIKSILGKSRIDLSTGEGIKNFLNLLNKSSKKGSLDTRIEDFYKTGEKTGKAIESDVNKLSESDVPLSREVNDLIGVERNEEGNITMTKEEWKSGYMRLGLDLLDPSNRLLDNNLLKAGGLKIGAGDIVIEGEGFSKERFLKDLKDKLKPVVENWDPQAVSGEKGGLLGWINNPRNLDNKKKSVFDDYTKEALAKKAARGEYVGAEKSSEIITPTEPIQAGRTNPLDVLSSDIRVKAIDEAYSKFPKRTKIVNGKEVEKTIEEKKEDFKKYLESKSYKTLKGLTTKSVAEWFGVAENKVSNPKDNLSQPEARSGQMKIAANKAAMIDMIPENNIPVYKEYETSDGKRVIDSKTGKDKFKYVSLGDVGVGLATGIPRNIKTALFNKGERIGNNTQFNRKPNLTESEILKTFGIEDGKRAGDFAVRTKEAQAIKGMMELVDRAIGNKITRDLANDLGLFNEALNLSQGKNVYMASETVTRNLPKFVETDFTLNHVGSIAERFANLPYGGKTVETVKSILNSEFKDGKRKYKTFKDSITGEEYTFTSKDINLLATTLSKAINKAKEIPFIIDKLKQENKSEINKRDIKEFIETELMLEGSERATQKFFGDLLPKDSKGKTISLKDLSNDSKNQSRRRQLADEMWRTQVKETENKVEWINNNFGLSEQFNSASKIGGGRFQYYKGIENFKNEFNKSIKDSGYTVVKDGSKYFIETTNGKRIKEIDRFGKTQSNSEYAIKKLDKAFNKDGVIDINAPEVIELVETYENVAQKAKKILDGQFEFMMNKYKTGEITATDVALFTMELKSGMGTVLRMAAPLKEMYEPLPGEKLIKQQSRIKKDADGNIVYNSKGKPVREKLLIWEHSKPAEQMVFEMLDIYLKDGNIKEVKLENDITRYELNESGKKALEEAYSGYEVAIIPKAMDNVITAIGRAEGAEAGKDRYYDDLTYGRPEMRATRNLVTGELKGYEWAIAAEQASNVKLAKENSLQGEPSFTSKSQERNNFDYIKDATAQDNALNKARDPKKKVKKARVFDFDDTVAKTKSKVFATKEGERKILTAEDFAKQGAELVKEGWKMDFSDFNKVVEGEKGPLFDVMKNIKESPGNRDMFILTARAPESAPAIHEFLKEMGIDMPLENITGLGNSTGEAKAKWLVEKASEGYNDFYFADDAPQNVKAVKEALEVLDVKSKTQRALVSESENRSIEFNKILENKSGIEYYKTFSSAKAKTIGANKGKFKFFIPPSAEDFAGLIYPTLGKGKLGDKQMAWYKTNLLNPFARANDNLSKDRVQLMSDFKELKKELDVPKDLRKKNNSGFTNEDAVRIYLFDKTGNEVPGISKADLKELKDVVESNPNLKAFAEQILTVTKGDGYAKPGENWLVGTITTDLIDLINTTKRAKYLEEWQRNADEIYSKENLNKLEAIYGPKYREAMENMLIRMKTGKNRTGIPGRIETKVLDYINGSNAAIMFFNTRSAVLQTISNINFLNWGFNNPAKAGIAFANQPQYWRDFTKLMNSDFLLDRRNGLRINIAESEVADAAATSKNKAKAVLNYILQKGYLPTQYADSFAIASGGATFYRNRISDLVKKGVPLEVAEAEAYKEFREIAETSQQSSRPDKISQQQSSAAGRLILMFANTPMQYARIQKRAFQDLANGRGDAKTNVSKIAYYGLVQNLIFNSLQQALFKMGFDNTDEVDEKAVYKTANGMLDSQLKGLGIGGASLSVAKNFLLDVYERSGRKRPEYVDAAWKLTQFSPPISSKISKIKQAAYPFDNKKMKKEIYTKGFSLDNPALMSGAKVVSATANIPLDRVLLKYDNIKGALSEDAEYWEKIAMMGGWAKWQLDMPSKSKAKSKKTNKNKSSFKNSKFSNGSFKNSSFK